MAKVVITFQTGSVRSKEADELVVNDEMRIKDVAEFCLERGNAHRLRILGIRPASIKDLRHVPHLLDS